MKQRCLITPLCLLPAPPARAAPIDPASFLGEFFNKASRLSDALVGASTELYRFSELEWTTFTVCALVIVLIKWTIGAAAVKDVLFVALMILIAQALLQSYNYVLALFWEIGSVLADDVNRNTYRALGLGASGLDSTGVFLLDLINHVMERFTFQPAPENAGFFSTFGNFAVNLRDGLFTLLFLIVLFAVFAVSWIISVIGIWSLMLGKVLGPLFIPFLIFKRAHSWFDNWLNFMLGSVAYFVIAQVNIALATLVMVELFNSTVMAGEIMTLAPGDLLRLLNYAGLLLVAVYAMFRTDRVVSDLVQGGVSASGAIGQAAAMMSARLVR